MTRIALPLLALTGTAASVAVTHMNNIPAYIVIAPGYLVQAWLFETHHALGGVGYRATMVGVSALVWTLILLGMTAGIRLMVRLIRHLGT